MNGTLFLLVVVVGLTTALPAKPHKTLHSRDVSPSNSKLGIYDGTKTTINKHNYLVGILIVGDFTCSGAIISESYVLTVGYWVEDYRAANITVVAGSSDGTTGTKYSVEKIIVNPNYLDITDISNFALLKIKGTFDFGKKIGKVTLPSANPKSGASLVVSGYGQSSSTGSEGTLLQGTLEYMTAETCETYYADYYLDWDSTMACAYDKGGVTMCEGDYGNPLTDGKVLYGLMADGGDSDVFCSSNAIPVIISNVYSVIDWINEYI